MDALSFAIRPGVVLKYLGQLSVCLGLLMVAPFAVAALTGETSFAWRSAAVALVALVGGSFLARLPRPDHVQRNEALVVSALAFLVASLALTYPLMTAGESFVDTLFESISGVTTTGLTTLAELESKSFVFLFTRAYMQWFGGLGFVVLSVALLLRPGPTARELVGWPAEDEELAGNTRAQARTVLFTYCGLTFLGVALLWSIGLRLDQALLHTLAAVSTGGYAPRSESLAAFSIVAQVAVLALSFAGAISLTVYARARRRGFKAVLSDVQLRGLVVALVIGSALVVTSLGAQGELPWRSALHHGTLLFLSAQTTAGFSTTSIAELGAVSKLLLVIAMFVGGSVGSTAGGLKMLRLLILFVALRGLLSRTSAARHSVQRDRLAGRTIDASEMAAAAAVLLLFVSVVLLSWICFLVAGVEPLDALFDVVSATGTVGLSTGVCAPGLGPALKGVLCADMLLGRLEVLALVVLFLPRTWFGRRRRDVAPPDSGRPGQDNGLTVATPESQP